MAIATPASLGSSDATNSIALSGGGRLSYTVATAADFGPNRSIAVTGGGGSISHNNATAAPLTVSGSLIGSGSDNLSFQSEAAGAGTFGLTGNNAGFTGRISADGPVASANGLTVLRFGSQSAVPGGGTISVNYPAAATVTGNAVTLDLQAVNLPAAVTLNMVSFTTAGNISQRG